MDMNKLMNAVVGRFMWSCFIAVFGAVASSIAVSYYGLELRGQVLVVSVIGFTALVIGFLAAVFFVGAMIEVRIEVLSQQLNDTTAKQPQN